MFWDAGAAPMLVWEEAEIFAAPTLLPVTAEPIELEEDLLPAVADGALAVLAVEEAFAAACEPPGPLEDAVVPVPDADLLPLTPLWALVVALDETVPGPEL